MAEAEAKAVIRESVLKKRNKKRKKNRANRKIIFKRGEQYAKEYKKQEEEIIQLKREPRMKGGFYVCSEAKLLFIIRIRGSSMVYF